MAVTFALSAVVLSACGGDEPEGPEVLPAVDDLPWPEVPAPSPSCTSVLDDFADPAVAPAEGSIVLVPSAVMEPLGVDVRVAIEVHDPDTGALDEAAVGPIELAPTAGLRVVSVAPLGGGRGDAVVRFEVPGAHVLVASIGGASPRDGSVGVWAYEPRLPIWEIDGDPAELARVLSPEDPYAEGLEAVVTLRVGDHQGPATLRLHGGSSRGYPKRSLRLDLPDDAPLPDGHRHVVLRSEWNDGSMLRNWLALRIVRETTWVPASEAELVHLRIGGAFYGLMNRVERVDADFFAARGLGTGGSLYEADPAVGHELPGANLEPLPADGYPLVYRAQLGLSNGRDLRDLIEQTLELPDEALESAVGQVVAVDDALVYLAAMAVLQNQDHVRKNYYLYRDPFDGDGLFRVLPWDLDLSLGHLWTEENDVLDETLFTDASIWVGEKVVEHSFYNDLPTRLWGLPALRARFLEILARLADVALDPELVGSWIDDAVCRAAPEMLADERKRAADADLPARIGELRTFVEARRAVVAAEVGR